MTMIIKFITSAISLSAIFLYGSTGETITEKAGHLNLGIPGIMSVGAAIGCISEYYFLQMGIEDKFIQWGEMVKSLISRLMGIDIQWGLDPAPVLIILAVLATFAGAGLMGLLYSFLTVTLRANQNVTGLAMTTFGVGLSGTLIEPIKSSLYTVARASKYFKTFLPNIDFLGDFGKIFFSHGVLVYLAIAIAVVAQIVLNKTRVGLHLRAVGENPATADAAGINVVRYKYVATVLGSGIAGLGGLFGIMDYMGGNWEYIMETFGWLSIALVIFTLWKPALSIPGSIIFAGLYIAASYINGITFAQIEIIKMLPYVVTIIVLVITSIMDKKENQPPASLGVNYFREER